MFCSKCGKELQTGAAFCSYCAAPVKVAPLAAPVPSGSLTAPAHPTATKPPEEPAPALPVVKAPPTRPQFHYGRSYLRWLLWIGMLGLGYGFGAAGNWLARNDPHTAFWFLITNFLGYLFFAPVAALLFALFGLMRTRPIALFSGIAIALGSGGVLGWAGQSQVPLRTSTASLTQDNVATTAAPSDAQSPKDACYSSYAAKQYADVPGKCMPYVVTLMPRLAQLRSSKDFKSAADLSAEMFDLSNMTVESYRATGRPEMARHQAMSEAGWAFVYLGALDSTDKAFADSHAAKTAAIKARLTELDKEFPGVIDAEGKLFTEGAH